MIRRWIPRGLKQAFWRVLARAIRPGRVRKIGEVLFRVRGFRRDSEMSLNAARSILVVRLDRLGDMVLTSGFLRELRRNAPHAHITLLVQPPSRALVTACPHIDEVIAWPPDASDRWDPDDAKASVVRVWRVLRLAARSLWCRRFDLAIIPRWGVDYYHAVFAAYLSGATQRVGYSESVSSEKARVNRNFDILLTRSLRLDGSFHEVEKNLKLLREMGGTIDSQRLELWTELADEQTVRERLLRAGHVAGTPLVAFGIGASGSDRVWPPAYFGRLGGWLHRERSARVVLIGSEGERALAAEIRARLGDVAIDMVGQVSLRECAALLKRCCLYVGNDTGPMHMAAAAGLPVVEISRHLRECWPEQFDSPAYFSPWAVPSVVVAVEDGVAGLGDIASISVERVQAAVESLWHEAARRYTSGSE
ncbi:MAG: glycosyltransferase family 9 protein [Chthoniobacteraceae bacterium]